MSTHSLAQNSDNDDNVIDDLDYDTGDMDLIVKDIQNKTRLAATIEKTNIILINQLRPGKRLLVFDLDYTLFDCKRYFSRSPDSQQCCPYIPVGAARDA